MTKRKNSEPAVCPVSGQKLTYSGRGRPPVFHSSVSAMRRREYRKTGK
jgi:hypothetical protein